jgi:penicillin-binding protein 1B
MPREISSGGPKMKDEEKPTTSEEGAPLPADRATHRRRRLPLAPLAIGAGLLFILAAIGGSCLTTTIPSSGSRQTVIFYSIATDLAPGARLDPRELDARLRRLGYREGQDPLSVGEFRELRDEVEIFLRPFRYPEGEFRGGRLRVRIGDGDVERVEMIDELDPAELRLEPERIAGYEGETGAVLNRLRLEDAPPLLVSALIAVEDRRFYSHPGIDPIGLMRALWSDLRHQDVGQGGSTLTQQLARSLYLRNEKTVLRKFREGILAFALELRYSKKEILEAYLNAVYWGYWGSMEIRGAREAAHYYLSCELEDADPAGIALLVGLIQAPNAYSPYHAPEKAKKRRDVVLQLLREKGILDEEQTKRALAKPLPSKRPPDQPADAAYFLDAARKEVERRAPAGTLGRQGTAIFTTLDPRDQAAAVLSLRQGIKDLERDHKKLKRKKSPLQGAVAVIDPQSGEVRALVGGRDFMTSPFNRAIDAQRQPGSLFKPFVYLAAFQNPRRADGSTWNPATVIQDEPYELRVGRKFWRPQNYDRKYRGPVTVRYALEHSLNVPTARVGNEVGIGKIASVAHDMGIKSQLQEYPSLSLGASEVNLLEITSAYATLAAEGTARATTLLRGILDATGNRVSLSPIEPPPGIPPQEAYLVTRLLQGVIDEGGTGWEARSLGVRGVVAGKTGTTDDYRDAWFIGYTPRRVAGVWVGFDKREFLDLSGATAALPIWASLMRSTMSGQGDGGFERPPGIVSVMIDPETGLIATGACPDFRAEEFVDGTQPRRECDAHGEGLLQEVKRLFRL